MRIYKKIIKQEIIAQLIKKIKQKKELSNIDDVICKEKLQQLLMQNKKLLQFFSEAKSFDQIKKSKQVDRIIKSIRRELRAVYGIYQTPSAPKIRGYLAKLKKELKTKQLEQTIPLHKKILALHLSSKERLALYPRFYKDIFAITGKPSSILDLACGLNPFSYPFMQLKDLTYTAIELNKKDADIIQAYFNIVKIKGKAIALDIIKKSLKNYSSDICFAFKLFDLIPNKIIERIVTELKVKWIIASFPTKTITQARMVYIRRGGFQRMLKRLGYSYKKVRYSNELVYIIKK